MSTLNFQQSIYLTSLILWPSDVYIFTQQIWNTCLHDSNSKESLSHKSNCVKPKLYVKKQRYHIFQIQRNKSRTRTFINCLVKPTSLITSLSQRTSVECVTQYSFMTVWNKRGGLDPLMVSNVWDASEDSGIDRLFSSWTQPWCLSRDLWKRNTFIDERARETEGINTLRWDMVW